MATLLNSQGATPSYGGLFTPSGGNYGGLFSSPQSKALNSPAPMASSVSTGQPIPGSITGTSSAPPPPSNQDVASQTHTSADGSSVTTKYQPSTSGLLSPKTKSPTGTPASQITTAGQTYTDTQGNTQTAKYDPMTGAPLPQPASSTSSGTTGGTSGTSTTPTPNTITSNPYSANAQAGVAGTLGAGQATYGQGVANANQYSTEANTALQQLQNIQTGEATGIGDINQQAIPLQFQQGRAQALQNMYGGQEQALATELSGLGSLYSTAAGQQGSGIAGLLGGTNAAITGQSNLLPTQNFPFVYNPATGTFTAPGVNGQSGSTTGAPTLTFNPSTDASTLANAVMNKQISFADAENALSYGGKNSAAATQLTSAVLAAGGNPTNLQATASGAAAGLGALAGAPATGAAAGISAAAAAPGQAQAGNIQTAGTAVTSAANIAYNNATQAVSKATGAYTAATGVASNLTSTLSSWAQSGQLTNLNQGLNTIAGLTSNPQYAQFNTAITNAQAAYTAAFQDAGITPTQSTLNALKELNPNSSATAIISSLNQLSSDLHAATIVPAYQQQQTYAQQLGITQ